MDSKMEVDTGKTPEPMQLSPLTEPASIPTLDGWIESLMVCKQLAENDVQRLCNRVSLDRGGEMLWVLELTKALHRHARFCKKNRTFSR